MLEFLIDLLFVRSVSTSCIPNSIQVIKRASTNCIYVTSRQTQSELHTINKPTEKNQTEKHNKGTPTASKPISCDSRPNNQSTLPVFHKFKSRNIKVLMDF
jgi:hypothetical protein